MNYIFSTLHKAGPVAGCFFSMTLSLFLMHILIAGPCSQEPTDTDRNQCAMHSKTSNVVSSVQSSYLLTKGTLYKSVLANLSRLNACVQKRTQLELCLVVLTMFFIEKTIAAETIVCSSHMQKNVFFQVILKLFLRLTCCHSL